MAQQTSRRIIFSMWALTNVKSEKSVKTEKYQFAPKSRHEGLVANRRLDFQEEGEINEKLGLNIGRLPYL